MKKTNISVVIPSYNRTKILLETIAQLLDQNMPAEQIIVVDQTHYDVDDPHARTLSDYDARGEIRWIQQTEPSIPKAMNRGLLESGSRYVLFLDDDVTFENDFLRNHQMSINEQAPLAQVGQIVQPWQTADVEHAHSISTKGISLNYDLMFAFNSSKPAQIQNCMAGNLCVDREAAIAIGGFDENFSKTAYRFESEFCKRFCIEYDTLFYYNPAAVLNHLYIKSGGTRAHSNFLTSMSSDHSFGDYYFAMLLGRGFETQQYVVTRLFTSIKAKFYLRKPWYIPLRLIGEIRGVNKARACKKLGQQLMKTP